MTVRSVIDELKEPPAGAPTPRYEMTDQSVNKLTDDLSTFHVRICLPRISPPVPEIRFVRAPAPLDLFIARWLWIKSIATKLWVMHPHGTGCTLQDSCGPDPAGDLRAAVPQWRTDRVNADGRRRRLAAGGVQALGRPQARRSGARKARRTQTHYSAQPQGLAPLIDWMSLYGAFWRDRFDRLETLLNRMDQ